MHAEKLHAEKQFFDVIQITNRVTLLARKSRATRKLHFALLRVIYILLRGNWEGRQKKEVS
jgi:hypothetical protein